MWLKNILQIGTFKFNKLGKQRSERLKVFTTVVTTFVFERVLEQTFGLFRIKQIQLQEKTIKVSPLKYGASVID